MLRPFSPAYWVNSAMAKLGDVASQKTDLNPCEIVVPFHRNFLCIFNSARERNLRAYAMSGPRLLVLAIIGSFGVAHMAQAEMPAAVVEEVHGKPAGIEFMDYVAAGKVIKLGPGQTVVLGYLRSCWRETITAGTVIVGSEQSEVQKGKVERNRVTCDGGQMQLSGRESSQSAGVISRAVETADKQRLLPDPGITIYGKVPMIELRGRGTLLVERLDQSERYQIAIGKRQLARGLFFDFAKADWTLAAGGLYRVTFGTHEVIFRVDPAATAAAPVVARLIRF